MTVAVLNLTMPSSMSSIVRFAAAPAGKGQAHFEAPLPVGVQLEPPPVPVPADEVLWPAVETTLPPAVPGAPPLAGAPAVPLRSLPPLPPQADPKAAAPASSTATAQKRDFEEYRMGSTDHLAARSSQCSE